MTTLTDALAAALGDLFPHYQREKWPFTAVQAAAAILADPAVREALTAALAEADFEVHEDGRYGDRWTELPVGHYREWWFSHARHVVAHMLPEDDHDAS